MEKFNEKLKGIIKKSQEGKIITNGINVGIIGRPNVGKSSLLNALLEEEKAIVTDIEGTTRDIVEGNIILNGVVLNIIDTAGIRQTNDIVEKIGVQKSKEIINKSDLVILILNNNEILQEEDKKIFDLLKDKKHITVINKSDLEQKIDLNILTESYIKTSIKNGVGLEDLKKEIIKLFNLGQIESDDLTYLTDARSISLLKKSLEYIDESIKSIDNNEPIEIVELGIKQSWETLGEIIGETYKEELLDELFSRFCLGK